MLFRATLVWLVLMALAIANGAFREAILVPRMGKSGAHVASTAMLCAAIVAIALVAIRWLSPSSARDGVEIGVFWLVLVLAFEFGFGHFVARKSWSDLLADYDVLGGRVWLAVPVTTAVAPYLAARLRGLW